jgi:hypothetical protein
MKRMMLKACIMATMAICLLMDGYWVLIAGEWHWIEIGR